MKFGRLQKMKKAAGVLLIITMAGLALSGCRKSGDNTDPEEKAREEEMVHEASSASGESLPDLGATPPSFVLTWRTEYADPAKEDPVYSWALAAYESWEKKEDFTLELVPVAESEEQWNGALSERLAEGENCPSLVIGSSQSLAAAAEGGLVHELSADAAEYGDWAWYYGVMQDMASFGGSVYGIPCSAAAAGLWYDADKLLEAGVIEEGDGKVWEPGSTADILEACSLLLEADPEAECIDVSSQVFFELLLFSNGGRLVTENGTWISESESIEKTAAFLNEVYQQGYASEPGSAGAVIKAGFYPPAEGDSAAFGFAPMPAGSGEESGGGLKAAQVSEAEGLLLEIPENAPDKETAWSFLCHMMSREQYLSYVQKAAGSGVLSTRKDTSESPELLEMPFYSIRQNLLEIASLRPQGEVYEDVKQAVEDMLKLLEMSSGQEGVEEAVSAFSDWVRDAAGK